MEGFTLLLYTLVMHYSRALYLCIHSWGFTKEWFLTRYTHGLNEVCHVISHA